MPSDFDRKHAEGIKASLASKLTTQKKGVANKMWHPGKHKQHKGESDRSHAQRLESEFYK